MTEKDEKQHERRRYPSLVWPIILITAGVLFLLSNLGVLDINYWGLWRLWPVLLILSGLEILVGRRSALGNVVVVIITLAVVGGVVLLLLTSPDVLGASGSASTMEIDEPLDGAERADLDIDFAAGELTFGRLSDSAALISARLDLATSREPAWEINRRDETAEMTLGYRGTSFQSWGRGDDWEVHLSPRVGYTLDINIGAGSAELDLTGLDIRDFRATTGAGRVLVILPDEGDLTGKVTGGAGQLIIKIPEDMAALIRVQRGLGALTISDRFSKTDDGYVTGDWHSNDNRVELDIEVGVGQVIIREP